MMAIRDFKPLVDELPRQSWDVSMTGQGHYKAIPPDKTKEIVVFSTSDDHHAFLNTVRKLRDQGFVWPPPSKNELRSQRNGTNGTNTFDDPPETVDDIWRDLKAAKENFAFAEEMLRDATQTLEQAQRDHSVALAEKQKAADVMKRIKGKFDRAFEPS